VDLKIRRKNRFSESLGNHPDCTRHCCNVLGKARHVLVRVAAVFQAPVELVAVTVMQSIRALKEGQPLIRFKITLTRVWL
jgi:hypothetical protein